MSLVGQQISHYKIIEKLGSGGMGLVYKAKDLKLDRLVALKFLNKDLITEGEFRQRFINEAKAISALEHPNIAVIYEIDEVDDFIFISMGYYQGDTLQELISKGPLPINEAYSYGLQIVQGLMHAHNAGIIHRDIKPGNIIITDEGQAKILDFGLAKVMHQTEITQQDSVIGTTAYMSPEQIQGMVLDHRTDIFSFGALLYEMISGERPFQGDYGAALLYSILNENPTSLHLLRPEIPIACENVVNKALTKDREKRYQTTDEIERDLKDLSIDRLNIPTRLKRKFTFSFQNNRILAIIAIMFVCAVVISLFFVLQPNVSTLDAQRYYLEGKNAAFDRRYHESIEKLKKAIDIDPTYTQAYYFLAWQYAETADNVKAKEILAKGKPYINQASETERLEYLSFEASLESRWMDYVLQVRDEIKIENGRTIFAAVLLNYY